MPAATKRSRPAAAPAWVRTARATLRCPACGGSLDAGASVPFGCKACGRPVVVNDGIVDFVAGAASTLLDTIDYDAFYGISADHSQGLYEGLRRCTGDLWPRDFGTALEIGCGTGGLSLALFSHIQTDAAVLTDISPKMLRICRNRLTGAIPDKVEHFTYATFSGTESCFKRNSFDSCFGTAVVHHITDVPAFLRIVHDLLKPGGLAFFMEPSRPFHAALTATLADIVADFIRNESVPEADRSRMLNWMSEVHCNIVNSGDTEVLSHREDKHYFLASEFLALARDAGFEQVTALPTDPDRNGAHTIQVYLQQVQISTHAALKLAKAWLDRHKRYFSPLPPLDQCPSYLFWLRKSPRSGPAAPIVPPVAPVPRREALKLFLEVERIHTDDGATIAVQGWCLSDIAAASLQISIGIARHRLPIWIPRPDIQQDLNRDGYYPALCALCCGIQGSIELPKAFEDQKSLTLTFQIILSDRRMLPAGTMTLRAGDTKKHQKVIPA